MYSGINEWVLIQRNDLSTVRYDLLVFTSYIYLLEKSHDVRYDPLVFVSFIFTR